MLNKIWLKFKKVLRLFKVLTIERLGRSNQFLLALINIIDWWCHVYFKRNTAKILDRELSVLRNVSDNQSSMVKKNLRFVNVVSYENFRMLSYVNKKLKTSLFSSTTKKEMLHSRCICSCTAFSLRWTNTWERQN